MKVTITARHCDISQELRQQTTEDIQGLLTIFDNVSRADVIYAEDGPTPQAEVTVHWNQKGFNAKGEGVSHQQAFSVALERAERQLRKFKDKMIGRRDTKEI